MAPKKDTAGRRRPKPITIQKGGTRKKAKRINGQPRKKTAPAATFKWTDTALKEEQRKFTGICSFCEFIGDDWRKIRLHILQNCTGIGQINVLKTAADTAFQASNKIDHGLPKDGKKFRQCVYAPPPLDGLAHLCDLPMPPNVCVAPHNFLIVNVGANKDYQQTAIRSRFVPLWCVNIKTKEYAQRTYYDAGAHEEWETMTAQKLDSGEVDVVAIPVLFYYGFYNVLKNHEKKDHAALLMLKRIPGTRQFRVSFMDSVPRIMSEYYDSLLCPAVKQLICRLLPDRGPRNLIHIKREVPYHSVNTNGCQAVVGYYLIKLALGQELDFPSSSDVISAVQQTMHNFGPHPKTEGDKIDALWKVLPQRIAN